MGRFHLEASERPAGLIPAPTDGCVPISADTGSPRQRARRLRVLPGFLSAWTRTMRGRGYLDICVYAVQMSVSYDIAI